MPYLFEFVERWSTYSLRRRIGKDIMILFFKLPQVPEKTVIFLIGNDRGIQDIISVIVLVDLSGEAYDFLLDRIW